MPRYAQIADELASDIAAGVLAAGARLLPLREFAYRRGIASSTAARVYAELARRGLTMGEVGRGTCVRHPAVVADAPVEPAAEEIDLAMILAAPPGSDALLLRGLRRAARSPGIERGLRPFGPRGWAGLRELSAGVMSRRGWRPHSDDVLFAASGRAGIAAALASIARPGDRVGVEALTYPAVKGIAARLGLKLVPLEMDGEGALPEAARLAHREASLACLYLQPILQSPLGVSMGEDRIARWVDVLEATGLVVVEDAVYGFLAPDTLPLSAALPGRVILVDSLSKRVAPGINLGLLVAPARLRAGLEPSLRGGGWTGSGINAAVAAELIVGGEVDFAARIKRDDAVARQRLAQELLGGCGISADARAYHVWLPTGMHRAADVVREAARLGVAVTRAGEFAVMPGHEPSAVRLALASPSLPQLRAGLTKIRALVVGDRAR